MKILIIEDDLNKLDAIRQLIVERFPDSNIIVGQSFQSGRQLLVTESPHIVILDMQLPTFDKTPSEDGGRGRPLAGKELLYQIERRALPSFAIVVTQFQEFGDEAQVISLAQLRGELASLEISKYVGLVYYAPGMTDWKDDLAKMISKCSSKIK